MAAKYDRCIYMMKFSTLVNSLLLVSLVWLPNLNAAHAETNLLDEITSQSAGGGDGFGLEDEMGGFLAPEQAFRLTTETLDNNTLIARWQIADGYYLYKDKFRFTLKPASQQATLDAAAMPDGKVKDDPLFGNIEVYYHETEARIPIRDHGGKPLTLEISYQGCAEAGLCYPPAFQEVAFDPGRIGSSSSAVAAATPATAKNGIVAPAPSPANEMDRFLGVLQQGSLLTVILAALGAGLILAFTACMYPMIPILSSIIVGQGEEVTVPKAFGLSLVYVESMALTFGVIGATMAWLGGGIGIQAYFQDPWLLIPFAILFVILALAMFDFFHIQMPAAIQSRLHAGSHGQKGGTLAGVAIMGILSALIIGPCGGPVLIAGLSYAASSGDMLSGFIALFSLGNGMGLPLLIVGISGGKLLPRAGDWMNAIKAIAGVILLAVAIVILERMPSIFPPALTMLMWAALFIISATYMGALEPLPVESSGWRRLWKGSGIVMMLYGLILMLGGLSGASDVTNPLHGSRLLGSSIAMPLSTTAQATPDGAHAAAGFTFIKSVEDLERELQQASLSGKSVMLDFYADWCTYCKQYEAYVFPQPGVQQALANTVLLQADVTATDAQDKALMQRVGVFLPPAILFFGKDGKELRPFRVVGSMDADEFRQHVKRALQ